MKERDLILRDFFPPERTERTHGVEVEVWEFPRADDRPSRSLQLVIHDLAEPPSEEQFLLIEHIAASILAELGRCTVQTTVRQREMGLTDAECRFP